MVLNLFRSIQWDHDSCGARAVFSIMKYFEIDISYNEVYDEVIGGHDYANEERISKAFHKIGLSTRVKEGVSLLFIKSKIRAGLPILVTFNDFGHWVVIKGFDRDHVYVADSNLFAPQKLTNEKFMKKWSKDAIVVKKIGG
jgi:ABC-type bacteriocin/lantibiotic exporter with double-glycine peptidase domain